MTHKSNLQLHFDADVCYSNGVNPIKPSDNNTHTIIVVGLARGGTSSIAAVLDAIGVFMGPAADLTAGGCFENFAFVHCDPDNPGNLAEYFRRLDETYPRWGFKMTSRSAFDFVPIAANPRLVVVTRDPLAIATSGAFRDRFKSDGMKFVKELSRQSAEISLLARASGLPAIYISYERAVRHHMEAITTLAAFCGVSPDASQICEAHARLRPFGGYMGPKNNFVTSTGAWSDR